MIRVAVQHAPALYSLGIADDAAITPTFEHNGTAFYLAERHGHYVLYKAAGRSGAESRRPAAGVRYEAAIGDNRNEAD